MLMLDAYQTNDHMACHSIPYVSDPRKLYYCMVTDITYILSMPYHLHRLPVRSIRMYEIRIQSYTYLKICLQGGQSCKAANQNSCMALDGEARFSLQQLARLVQSQLGLVRLGSIWSISCAPSTLLRICRMVVGREGRHVFLFNNKTGTYRKKKKANHGVFFVYIALLSLSC